MLCYSFIALALLSVDPLPRPDTVVVCPSEFRAALEPWVKLRTDEGHRISVCDNRGTADEVRGRIRAASPPGVLKFVVLVGDTPPPEGSVPAALRAASFAQTVPTHYAVAKVNVQWGSEPEIATDNYYADLDGDEFPDVAVGRLSADSAAELATMTNKIVAYEQQLDGGSWQRRLNFVAGASGAGRWADAALESLVRSILCQNIPASYATSMTYASWTSPYCPPPALVRDYVAERLSEGSLFWVYMGHGQRRYLDFLRVPQGLYSVFHARETDQLHATAGRPIAVLLACYIGQFDAADDCLAEELLRAEGGPVAAVASSRVTMPYGMGVLGLELLGGYFHDRPLTLGEWFLNAKCNSLARPRIDEQSRMLDAMAKTLNPKQNDLAEERREHALLFNLLGDPLLRLPQPGRVEVSINGRVEPGAELSISGTSPIDGPAEIELVVRRDRLTFQPPPRREYVPTAAMQSQFQDVYRRANNPQLASLRTEVRDRSFAARLTIPAEASGPCHVRIFVTGAQGCALGSADVEIRSATAVRSATTRRQ